MSNIRRQPSGLISTEDKIAYLQQLTQSMEMEKAGSLYRPASQWYSPKLSAADLLGIATQLCRWLGFKPRHLTVGFSGGLGQAPGSYHEDDDGHHIVINQRYAAQSYQAIAILAHELAHYIVSDRWRLQMPAPDDQEEMVVLATVYLGLGLLVINGLNRRESWIERLWGRVWPWQSVLQLGNYSPKAYARLLGHYVAVNPHLTSDDLYRQLAPWSLRLFGESRPAYSTPVAHVRRAAQRIRRANLVLCGSLVLAAMVAGLTIFIARQQPAQAPASLIAQKQQADMLFQEYNLCQSALANQQASMPQAGVLEQETLAQAAARCTSLKNQYNAAADAYNQAITY